MKIYTKTVWDMSTGEKLEEEWYEYDGPIAEASGGGGTSTNTVKENADPWINQQPYLENLFNEAATIYGSQTPTYYTGQQYATQYQPSGQIPVPLSTLNSQYTDQIFNSILSQYDLNTPYERPREWDGSTLPRITTPTPESIANIPTTQYVKPPSVISSPVAINPGARVAGFSPETIAAQNYLTNIATTDMPAFLDNMVQAQNFGLGPIMDVGNNPYVQGAAQASIDPVFQELYRTTLPSIGSEALVNNAYGGSRQQLAQGLATGEATREALNSTRQLYNDAYDTGVNNYIKALALAPQTLSAMSIPGTTLDAVGQQKQTYQQALMDEAARQWDFYQQAPWDQLGNFSNMIQGFYGGSSTGFSTADTPQASPVVSAAGGAMAGDSMTGSPYGAAIGAFIGLLASS